MRSFKVICVTGVQVDPFVQVAFKSHPILAGGSNSWMVRFTRILPTVVTVGVSSVVFGTFVSIAYIKQVSLLRYVTLGSWTTVPQLRKFYEDECEWYYVAFCIKVPEEYAACIFLGFYHKTEGNVLLKRWYLSTELHGVTCEKNVFFKNSCVIYLT
jgi:hypothetical protein